MLNKIRKLQNKKGFTLVELIVVIAIIAILTAVIVPLVGRYSAQATYTTLMDAAQTVSNSANDAMSSAGMMGAVCTAKSYVGSKTNGKLTVTAYSDAAGSTAISGASKEVDASAIADVTASNVDLKAVWTMANSLAATLPDGCSFFVEVNKNAVLGVIYSTSETVSASTGVSAVAGFEKAYENSTSHNAIGVSGKFIPATT